MARPKEFDPEAALAAAMELFWRKGYDKTSLDDLGAATGVGRQSLYDTFGDKRRLYLRALDAYRESTQAALRKLLASHPRPREGFEALFLGIVNEPRAGHERGCLLLAANLERDLGDREIAQLVKRNQVEVVAIFEEALARGRAAGDLAADKDPAAIARFFLAAIQGLRASARVRSDRAALEQIARLALTVLE
jgi:AcrR family transcriptional regulator